MILEDLLNPANQPAIVHCNNLDEIEGIKQFFLNNCFSIGTTVKDIKTIFDIGVYGHIKEGIEGYENRCSFSLEGKYIGYCDREFYEEDYIHSQWPHYEYSDLVAAEVNIDDFAVFLLEE